MDHNVTGLMIDKHGPNSHFYTLDPGSMEGGSGIGYPDVHFGLVRNT